MIVCNLASGSKGNCTYVETKNHKILIDIGTSSLYVEKALSITGGNKTKAAALLGIKYQTIDNWKKSWEENDKKPEGRIIEVIEDCGDLNTEMIEFINKYII